VIGRVAMVGLAVAIIGAGAWFAVGPGAGPPFGECSMASPRPTEAASPSIGDDPPAVSWTASGLPAEIDDADEQIMVDVAAFRDGYVAVGRTSIGPEYRPFLLRSTDGLVWESVPLNAPRFAVTDIHALAVVGERLFALGSASTNDRGGSRGIVWFSDDATVWREANGPFAEVRLSSLAGREGELLLIGADNQRSHPVAWTSTDGADWDVQSLQLPVRLDTAGFSSVDTFGDGWMAAGSISAGVNGPSAPVSSASGTADSGRPAATDGVAERWRFARVVDDLWIARTPTRKVGDKWYCGSSSSAAILWSSRRGKRHRITRFRS